MYMPAILRLPFVLAEAPHVLHVEELTLATVVQREAALVRSNRLELLSAEHIRSHRSEDTNTFKTYEYKLDILDCISSLNLDVHSTPIITCETC